MTSRPRPPIAASAALALLSLSPLRPALGGDSLPRVPDGFVVDLVAEVPEVLWPSALLPLPDGSLLVAEDPMDMVGPTDSPSDRILLYRFGSDGAIEKTVFAEKLFAVFGLEWIDGAVYVMNMPHLTVLFDRDGDGVAEERRKLLTTLGRPAPGWPGGFNDHIVSGIRLGMDGFLYVSVGDKGVPRAIGTDGTVLSLRGGGVVRLEADGGGLEVVASGTRNHLDVAMDPHDHVFTYDNTDDGLGWWTRFSHVVETGYYGYPWDYRDHPERFLPALAEYGGGSPCGGLVYNEAAWPEPYRGSVFFCEWGQGLVRRFEVARDGAGYRVVTAEDFMTAGGATDFRPLDVAVTPGGDAMYVADWNYGGWTSPKRTGRIFRVRRAGAPLLPRAASPVPADVPALVAALDDPSFSVRLAAERRLAATGSKAVEPLRGVLLDPLSSDRARRHAIWGLSLVGRRDRAARRHETDLTAPFSTSPSSREAIAFALGHTSADTRAEAARALGVRGKVPVPALVPLLEDPDAMVRRAAAIALGRSGDASAAPALVAALGATDDAVLRFVLRRALERVPDPVSLASLLPRSEEPVRKDLLLVLRERCDLGLVRALARMAGAERGEATDEVRADALFLLAEAHREREPWDGSWWQIQPARSGWPPKTVEWDGTAVVTAAVRDALFDRAPAVRSAAVRSVASMGDRALLPDLRAAFAREPLDSIRAAALEALAAQKDVGAAGLLLSAIRDEAADPAMREKAVETAAAIGGAEMAGLLADVVADGKTGAETALAAIGALARAREGARSAVPAIESRLPSADPSLRAAAVAALVEIEGRPAAERVRLLLADPESSVRAAAVRAIGKVATADDVPHLLPLARDEGTRAEATVALARVPDERSLGVFLDGLGSASAAAREAGAAGLRAIRDAARPEVEARAVRGEISERALAAVRRVYCEPRPLARYRLAGPFPKNSAVPEVPPGDSSAWRDVSARERDGFVDLNAVFGKNTDAIAIAAADVESPVAREARMTVGSDDSIAVELDGETVHSFGGDRAFGADQDAFRVRLREGTNSFVFRIGQTGGDWSFAAKIEPHGEGPLFDSAGAPDLVQRLREAAKLTPGDPERGRELFFDEKGIGCFKCHVAGGRGESVGPDLSSIGSKYSRDELVASVLEPSLTMYDEYRATTLVLADERVLVGQVRDEKDGELALVDAAGERHRVLATEIRARMTSDRSSMPEGLVSGLDPADFAHLVSFLASLRAPAEAPDAAR